MATRRDAHQIAHNNIQLAQESENLSINYDQVLRGVTQLIGAKKRGFYIVAEEAADIIGQLMITYEWSDWQARDIWWLQSIFVKKEWRKKGVMTQLIKEIQRRASQKDILTLRLYVYKYNKGAMQSYEKIGMTKAPYHIYTLSSPK